MREILFKAKRIDNGEWVEGGYSYCKKDDTHYITNMGKDHISHIGFHQPIDSDTICQFTGLYDENGNKIWENDVVECLGNRGVIVFECGSFGIAVSDYINWDEIADNILPVTSCDKYLCACLNDHFVSLWEIYENFNDEDNTIGTLEVIGNIFDNPELLEGGAE